MAKGITGVQLDKRHEDAFSWQDEKIINRME
jgi:hypothetical protein